MKKSIRRKLIMSSVAVSVAILGTSAATYAWFVTNNNVSSSVSGNVESAGASLYVSKTATSFGTSPISIEFKNEKLAPLQAIKSGTDIDFKHLNRNTVLKDGEYYSYDIYFSVQNVSSEVPRTLSMELVGNDVDYKDKNYKHTAQANVAESSTYKEIKMGEKYWENILKALDMNISYVTDSEASKLDSIEEKNSVGNYQLNSDKSQYDGFTYYKNVNGLKDDFKKDEDVIDPTEYISENDLDKTDVLEDENAGEAKGTIPLISNITSAGYYKFTFKIWLNGWDDAAFDAVASHSFNLNLNFSLK